MDSDRNGSFQMPSELRFEAELSLRRLMPRVDECWDRCDVAEPIRHEFQVRLEANWEPLFALLYDLYGSRYDFFFHLEQILLTAVQAWANRPEPLRAIDRHRVNEPEWFQFRTDGRRRTLCRSVQ